MAVRNSNSGSRLRSVVQFLFGRTNNSALRRLHQKYTENVCSIRNYHVTNSGILAMVSSLRAAPSTSFEFGGDRFRNETSLRDRFMLYLTAAAGGSLLYSSWSDHKKKIASCCGIVAYIGDKAAEPILMEGVQILQNRGYDSCGLVTIDDHHNMTTTKFASKGSTSDSIELLSREAPKNHGNDKIGLAHTRWATHGPKTDINAHPHSDYKNRIALVHNGSIDNYSSLKKRLQEKHITFKSDTDSEVIANLIGSYLDEGEGFEEAVKMAVSELQGTWGLCIVHKDYSDRIVLARNGSPLLVGTSEGQVFIASEASALARHTNQYLSLKDGELAVITREGIDHLVGKRALQKIHVENVETSPAPYKHWTIKEIHEQPQSLARALNYGGRITPINNKVKLGGLDAHKEELMKVRNLVIGGCGTSLYAGMYGELLMQWLNSFDGVRTCDASEIESNTFNKKRSGLLLISQSGETLDTVRCCELAEANGIRRVSIVNVVGSLLARMTGVGVYCNAGREVAVASTKAFTSQVTVLALVAAWFAQNKDETSQSDKCKVLMDAIHRLPVYAGMTLAGEDQCKEVAKKIKDAKSIFVLGKGFGYPAALEGALKIKEISYIHAEGFAGSALKHGPFALIDGEEKTPVIMIILSDQHASLMLNAAEQVKARGAHVICITDDPDLVKDVCNDIICVPSNGPLTALLCVLPLQLIAYHLADLKGYDPDKPRGLAKTVTVL